MTVCDNDKCAGCMLCLSICKKNAIHIHDEIHSYNAYIDEEKCINCSACHKKCPQNNSIPKVAPIAWYQGWNNDIKQRDSAPSGGVGMALIKQFIQDGGYVSSCVFRNGTFLFDITNDYEEAMAFGGSKYVKSNPLGIYEKVFEKLKNGYKVMFIGLPCQVAAVKNYVGKEFEDNLYLVDLICHGTPSPQLLDIFLAQYNKSLKTIQQIAFRIKAKMQIVTDGEGIVCKGVSDKYTIGFLNGLTYTDNCYSCKYASVERVSDITIGDSWGSDFAGERKRGISLILLQTTKGKELVENSDISLYEVDLSKAIKNNEQLCHPMKAPHARIKFFRDISRVGFNKQISKYYRSQCMKQDAKLFLLKLGIIK